MKKMYITNLTCDELDESTVAFQVSTIKPEITPTNGNLGLWERLKIPMARMPRRLMPIAHQCMGDYPCRVGRVEDACNSLHQFDHYHAVDDLKEKLRNTLQFSTEPSAPILTAVTITDGRVVFKIWEPTGLLDIMVLPDRELMGGTRFDFGLQTSRRAKSGIRIAYDWDVDQHHYIVEYYNRWKVYATKDIYYRSLSGNEDKIPHYTGYMKTLTVI